MRILNLFDGELGLVAIRSLPDRHRTTDLRDFILTIARVSLLLLLLRYYIICFWFFFNLQFIFTSGGGGVDI